MEPKSFLTKLLECAIILALSSYLIKLAVCYIVQIWPFLVIIAILVIAGFSAYNIWKHKHDSNW